MPRPIALLSSKLSSRFSRVSSGGSEHTPRKILNGFTSKNTSDSENCKNYIELERQSALNRGGNVSVDSKTTGNVSTLGPSYNDDMV